MERSMSFDEEVVLYPNPVKDVLHVNLGSYSKYTVIKIFTSWGMEVKQVLPVHITNQINVQDLPSGNYILTLSGYNPQKSFKFTKL